MNCYVDIETVKSRLGITGTARDAEVLSIVKAASRFVDLASGRDGVTEGFFTVIEERYFDVADDLGCPQSLYLTELL